MEELDVTEVVATLGKQGSVFDKLMDRYMVLQELMQCEDEIAKARASDVTDIDAIRVVADRRRKLLEKINQ